jgi:hypothetical protein
MIKQAHERNHVSKKDIRWLRRRVVYLEVVELPSVIAAVNQIIPWPVSNSDKDNRQREVTAENKPCNGNPESISLTVYTSCLKL